MSINTTTSLYPFLLRKIFLSYYISIYLILFPPITSETSYMSVNEVILPSINHVLPPLNRSWSDFAMHHAQHFADPSLTHFWPSDLSYFSYIIISYDVFLKHTFKYYLAFNLPEIHPHIIIIQLRKTSIPSKSWRNRLTKVS